MQVATKVFTSGNSQAVRIPKHFRLDSTDVLIHKEPSTGALVITPKEAANDPVVTHPWGRKNYVSDLKVGDWDELFRRIEAVPYEERHDFMLDRQDAPLAPASDLFPDWDVAIERKAA